MPPTTDELLEAGVELAATLDAGFELATTLDAGFELATTLEATEEDVVPSQVPCNVHS